MKQTMLIGIVAIAILVILVAGLLYFGSGVNYSYPTTTTTSIVTTTTTPAQTTTTAPQTSAVSIQNFAFNPATLNVKVGTTVIWTNLDTRAHTVTSDSGSELNSPTMPQGQTYSHVFNSVGTFTYHCSIHLNMKGTVVVTQ